MDAHGLATPETTITGAKDSAAANQWILATIPGRTLTMSARPYGPVDGLQPRAPTTARRRRLHVRRRRAVNQPVVLPAWFLVLVGNAGARTSLDRFRRS
jgi:hypothetical protein